MAGSERTWHDFAVVFRELGDHVDGRSAYEDDLQAELRRLGVGEVRGGGTWLDGSGCDIDLRVSDPVTGLQAIRQVLRDLAAPFSTRIVGDAGDLPVYESEQQYHDCLRAELARQEAEEEEEGETGAAPDTGRM